jgi:hypothetical protein
MKKKIHHICSFVQDMWHTFCFGDGEAQWEALLCQFNEEAGDENYKKNTLLMR